MKKTILYYLCGSGNFFQGTDPWISAILSIVIDVLMFSPAFLAVFGFLRAFFKRISKEENSYLID